MVESSGQAGEIEVTLAMIKAGVYAAKEHCLGEGLESLVSNVFIAMMLEQLDAKPPCLVYQLGKVVDEQVADR